MILIEFHKGLPLEHESFLVEKYDSFFTTCRYLEIYYPNLDVNYIAVTDSGKLIDILVFANNGTTTTCFNSLVDIDQNIISEFTKAVFEKYPAIQKIKIKASYKEYNLKKSILFSKSNDYIISLPSTMDEYFLELGHSTRKNLKNKRAKLLREYPQVNFITKIGTEIEAHVIEKIIQLNIERMKFKGIVPGRKANDKIDIYKYSQHYGIVSYVEIDGEIVAGNIAYVLNKRVFGHILGHDDNFSKYHVSKICQLYLIQVSIEKGLLAFHLLWGDNEYKHRFLGKPHSLFSYFIFRSYSFEFLVSKVNLTILHFFTQIRHSNHLKPIRDAIKLYRRKKWNSTSSISE